MPRQEENTPAAGSRDTKCLDVEERVEPLRYPDEKYLESLPKYKWRVCYDPGGGTLPKSFPPELLDVIACLVKGGAALDAMLHIFVFISEPGGGSHNRWSDHSLGLFLL